MPDLGDIENARQFCEDHRGRVLFDHSSKMWRVWDGRRWQLDQLEQYMELGKQTFARLQATLDVSPVKDVGRSPAYRLRNVSGLRSMAAAAQSLRELATTADKYDTDPLLFNCANGTLHLETLELMPHDPAHRISKLSPVAYDAAAEAPVFVDMLEAMFGGDKATIAYLLEVVGYCLSGLNQEKAFFILHGPGDTGKTTLVRALLDVFGDYGTTADISTFMPGSSGGASHRTDLATLVGARFVSASEGDRGFRLSEGLVKKVTGGSPLAVRELYGRTFTFDPTFKLMIDTNHLPRMAVTDDSMWNRVHLIPFEHQVARDRQRKTLLDELRAERSGILRMLLEGFHRYLQRKRLDLPAELERRREEIKRNEDVLGQFLEDECDTQPDLAIDKGRLHDAYNVWASCSGEDQLSKKGFSQRMAERGYRELRTAKSRKWQGIDLRPPYADDDSTAE